MKTRYTPDDLDTTIRTLLEMADEWRENGMEDEMSTAMEAALLLRTVRQETEEEGE